MGHPSICLWGGGLGLWVWFRRFGSVDQGVKAIVGLPPDFLSILMALVNSMRLSFKRKPHTQMLVTPRGRKSGSPVVFGPRTPARTWGTRPVPSQCLKVRRVRVRVFG